MICGKKSCANFVKMDCGFDGVPDKKCVGYVWNEKYPKEASEMDEVIEKEKDKTLFQSSKK
jgi:hypothetical protein